MKITDTKYIIINKNRGWRGLAELTLTSELIINPEIIGKFIFTFSPAVWDDLINTNTIIVEDEQNYYVIRFKDQLNELPTPTQQRSVLIKDFKEKVTDVHCWAKLGWASNSLIPTADYSAIVNYIHNNNRPTMSNWNAIGIRVKPTL